METNELSNTGSANILIKDAVHYNNYDRPISHSNENHNLFLSNHFETFACPLNVLIISKVGITLVLGIHRP